MYTRGIYIIQGVYARGKYAKIIKDQMPNDQRGVYKGFMYKWLLQGVQLYKGKEIHKTRDGWSAGSMTGVYLSEGI